MPAFNRSLVVGCLTCFFARRFLTLWGFPATKAPKSPVKPGTFIADVYPEKNCTMNLLVIDDDKEFLFLMSNKLKRQGFSVHTAINGVRALDVLAEHKIDLIISDVIMSDTPIMSLTCTLRNFYPKIPIILISGLPAEPLIHNSLTLGASEFIPKPINMGALYDTIHRLLPAA